MKTNLETNGTAKPEFLTRQELARRWKIDPQTVARRGDIKPVRFGARLLRYRLADVQAIEASLANG